MEDKLRKRFLLISIIPRSISDAEALKDLQELKLLVESYGGTVTELITQRREIHDKGGYVGNGKIQEAAEVVGTRRIDIVVLNAMVKPGQIYEMKSRLINSNKFVEVWDRIDLILQIFAKHAITAEARMQIELAAMRHMGPRIYGMGMELSRQTGGIGTRGIGETNTELMKRHWDVQMKRVRDKLKKLAFERIHQIERRKRVGLATVSLIGYTNAGKTSLFNALTKKNKHVEDALFVTLDSSVGKVFLPVTGREVLVSDTIGFIKNIPAELIEAFKSTLLESIHADILLHVIDGNDDDLTDKIKIVEEILFGLGLEKKTRYYIFNKIEKLNDKNREKLKAEYRMRPALFISAKTGEGLKTLLEIIENDIIKKAHYILHPQ